MLNDQEIQEARAEGERRRKAFIGKHPREKVTSKAPMGWDEPLKPKKRRRKKS